MVRKTNDKKVVKAIALGLAAMITAGTMQPMMAYAAEGDVDTDNAQEVSAPEESATAIDEAQKEVADVAAIANPEDEKDKLDTSELSKDTLKALNKGFASIDAAKGVDAKLDEAEENITKAEADLSIIKDASAEANKALESVEEKSGAVDEVIEAAKEALQDAKDVNAEAKTQASAANSAATQYNKKADKINAVADKGQALADEAVNAMNDANDVIQEKQEVFDAASNSASMQAAQDEMNAAYEEASKVFDEKVEALNSAKEELAAAEKEYQKKLDKYYNTYDEAVKAYNEQVGEDSLYDAAISEYRDQKALYDGTEDTAGAKAEYDAAVDGYNDQITRNNAACKRANNELNAAEKELAAAEKKLKALKDAADNAKKEVDAATNGAMSIIEAQNVLKENGGWSNADDLFEKYMEYYYVPEVLGKEVKSIELKKFDAPESNYFIVKLSSDETKYYNYKMGNDNGRALTSGNLVVFEKTETEVNIANAAKTEKAVTVSNKSTSENRYDVYQFEESDGIHYVMKKKDGSYVEYVDDKSGFSKVNDASNIQEFDGKLFKVVDGTPIELEEVPSESDTTDEETGIRTIVTVDEDSAKTEYVCDADGNIYKQTTKEVTTATYTQNSLSAEATYDSEADAQAALDEALGEDEKLDLDSEITETEHHEREATASVEYVSQFSLKIDTEASASWGQAFGFSVGNATSIEAKNEASNKVDDYYEKIESQFIDTKDGKVYVISVDKDSITKNVTDKEDVLIPENKFFDPYGSLKVKATAGVSCARAEQFELSVDKKTLEKYGLKKSYGKYNYQEAYTNYLNAVGADNIVGKETWVASIKADGKSAVISYVAKQTATATETVDKTDSTEAETAAKTSAENKLKESMRMSEDMYVIGEYSSSINETANKDYTKYGYSAAYWELGNKEETTELFEKVSTDNSQLNSFTSNSNWKAEGGSTSITDEKFAEFINKNSRLISQYDNLVKQVGEANDAVDKAQKYVEELKGQIEKLEKLKKEKKSFPAEVKKYQKEIKKLIELKTIKEDELEKAKELRDKLAGQLSDNVKKIEQKIAEEEAAKKAAEGSDGNVVVATGDDSSDNSVVIANANVPMAAAPAPVAVNTLSVNRNANAAVNVAAAVEEVAENEGAVEIADNNTPKAAEATKADNDKKVAIGDNDVALAAAPVEAEDAMNWWWLLVVAVLGATGYELYKKNQKKKALKEGADSLDK